MGFHTSGRREKNHLAVIQKGPKASGNLQVSSSPSWAWAEQLGDESFYSVAEGLGSHSDLYLHTPLLVSTAGARVVGCVPYSMRVGQKGGKTQR